MTRLLIAACGRSGTGFLATVLNSAGVPTGHESVFHAKTCSDPLWRHYQAEASWICLPWLSSLEFGHVRVVHHVRDPVRCASSFLGLGMFTSEYSHHHKPYLDHVRRVAPGVFAQDSELGRVVAYWVIWNETIERFASSRMRLEDLNAQDGSPLGPLLDDLFAVPEGKTLEAYAAVPRNVNRRRKGPPLDWGQLLDHAGDTYRGRLEDLASRYGYRL